MWCMGRNREIGVVERQLMHVSEVQFCVVAQPGAGVCGRLFILGDAKFTTKLMIRLLIGA